MDLVTAAVLGAAGMAAVGLIAFAAHGAYRVLSDVRNALTGAVETKRNLEQLAAIAEELKALSAGLTRVAEEYVKQVGRIETAASAFSKVLTIEPPEPSLREYNPGAADEEYTVQQLMARGIDRETAINHARNPDLYGSIKL